MPHMMAFGGGALGGDKVMRVQISRRVRALIKKGKDTKDLSVCVCVCARTKKRPCEDITKKGALAKNLTTL